MPDANQPRSGLERSRPYEFAAAAYCLVVAGVVGALAGAGRLPGHDLVQIAPFIAQLIVTGIAVGFAAQVSGSHSWLGGSTLLRGGSYLFAYGLGMLGLILAGHAAFGLTKFNAPALLLVVPGLAVVLPAFLTDEPQYSGAEVLNEPPQIPLRIIFGGFGASVVRQSIGWTMVIAGFLVAVQWYMALKDVLWNNTRYDVIGLANSDLAFAEQAWPAIFPFLFVGVVFAFSSWSPLLRQAWERIKEGFGFAGLSPQQRAVVQERLRVLWAYANAPENKKELALRYIRTHHSNGGTYRTGLLAHAEQRRCRGMAVPADDPKNR